MGRKEKGKVWYKKGAGGKGKGIGSKGTGTRLAKERARIVRNRVKGKIQPVCTLTVFASAPR